MTPSTVRILLADEHQPTRAFLAEYVPRHIFRLLCPGRLCARSGRRHGWACPDR